MHEVLYELRGLRAFVADCFDGMDSRLDAMHACFEGMATRITQLEDDMGFILHCFDPPAAP